MVLLEGELMFKVVWPSLALGEPSCMESGSLQSDRGLEELLAWKLTIVDLEMSRSLQQVLEVLCETPATFLNDNGGKLQSVLAFTNVASLDGISVRSRRFCSSKAKNMGGAGGHNLS